MRSALRSEGDWEIHRNLDKMNRQLGAFFQHSGTKVYILRGTDEGVRGAQRRDTVGRPQTRYWASNAIYRSHILLINAEKYKENSRGKKRETRSEA